MNNLPKYITEMAESERYIFGFVVGNADTYVENLEDDTTAIVHHYIVDMVDDDDYVMCVISQRRCGSAWSLTIDMYSKYDDEPESVVVDGWCGEHIVHKTYAERTWQSYSQMAEIMTCEIYDAFLYEDEISFEEYRPAA